MNPSISALMMSLHDLFLWNSSTFFKSILILVWFAIIWRRVEKIKRWNKKSEICCFNRSFSLNWDLRKETRMSEYLNEHDDKSAIILWTLSFFSFVIVIEMISVWFEISISVSRMMIAWKFDFQMFREYVYMFIQRSKHQYFDVHDSVLR
jgi:hypothetical protein